MKGVPADLNVCDKCEIKCATCETSAGNCLSCNNLKRYTQYQPILKFECIDVCPVDFYPNANKTECENCIFKNTYVFNGACVDECPDGFYPNGYRLCQNCKNLTKFIFENACVDICPPNTYPNKATRDCENCIKLGVFIYDNTCIAECPSGYFPEQITSLCKTCSDLKGVIFNNTCIDKCPESYLLKNGICEEIINVPTNNVTTINKCVPNPCHNGTCSFVGESIICTCNSGYYGSFCEKEVVLADIASNLLNMTNSKVAVDATVLQQVQALNSLTSEQPKTITPELINSVSQLASIYY
jgi:proprotein convertase subtilisin/kexin type 5